MWAFDPSALMENDQDTSAERATLKGTLKLNPSQMEIEGGEKLSLSSHVIAVVNLKILKYTFSGARIERVAVNQKGTTSISNFKDDVSVQRTIKRLSYAKDV